MSLDETEAYIDGLAQDCSNSYSSALALELRQSCPKPSICPFCRTLLATESRELLVMTDSSNGLAPVRHPDQTCDAYMRR